MFFDRRWNYVLLIKLNTLKLFVKYFCLPTEFQVLPRLPVKHVEERKIMFS